MLSTAASAQLASYPTSDTLPSYPFLSQPPPSQKKWADATAAPAAPTQSHERTNSFSSIATWAAQVHPGSPAPLSPPSPVSTASADQGTRSRSLSNSNGWGIFRLRRPSSASTKSLTHTRRRSSGGRGRRPSFTAAMTLADLTGYPFGATPSPSPTPSIKEFDLTAFGYTSVFLHLPKTPVSPTNVGGEKGRARGKSVSSVKENVKIDGVHAQSKPAKQPLKKLQSLSVLRPRSKSAASPSPSAIDVSSPQSQSPAEICTANVLKRKKAKYAYLGGAGGDAVAEGKRAKAKTKSKVKANNVPVPPSLAQDAALMQFLGGGSFESNVKKVMKEQAKAVAKTSTGGKGTLAVGDVYRDGKGGVWADRDEQLEYQHLLSQPDGDRLSAAPSVVEPISASSPPVFSDSKLGWIAFGGSAASDNGKSPGSASLAVVRKSSVSSQVLPVPPTTSTSAVGKTPKTPYTAFAIRTRAAMAMSMSVMALPSRPARMVRHLREASYVDDLAILNSNSSPSQSQDQEKEKLIDLQQQQRSASPSSSISDSVDGQGSTASTKSKKKPKRRPAPLELSKITNAKPSALSLPVAAAAARKSKLLEAPQAAPLTPTSILQNLDREASEQRPEPDPAVLLVHAPVPVPLAPIADKAGVGARKGSVSIRRQPSKLNVKGLFGLGGKKGDGL